MERWAWALVARLTDDQAGRQLQADLVAARAAGAPFPERLEDAHPEDEEAVRLAGAGLQASDEADRAQPA